MSRCPNGSRRNRKTGLCVKSSVKSRCPKGSRRNRKTGACRRHNKTVSLSKDRVETLLSRTDILNYIDAHRNLSSEQRNYLLEKVPALQRMKYDKKHLSCFTNKPTLNRRAMVNSKIDCYLKYGDDI